MTVDEIFKDRKKFSEQVCVLSKIISVTIINFNPKVYEQASTDLFNMGISVSLSPKVHHQISNCDHYWPDRPDNFVHPARDQGRGELHGEHGSVEDK